MLDAYQNPGRNNMVPTGVQYRLCTHANRSGGRLPLMPREAWTAENGLGVGMCSSPEEKHPFANLEAYFEYARRESSRDAGYG